MVFGEGSYRVLIASSAPKLNEVLTQMLSEAGITDTFCTASASAARRELLSKSYDFAIINAPLPDDFGTRLAADATTRPGTVALLLIRGENYEEVSAKMTPQGIFTLSKPTTEAALRQAVNWLTAARERLRKLEQKSASVEERMEEIRLVNRAKWLLIEQLKMTESEAHRHIEKQAMDRCATRRDIALGIIKTYT